MGRTRDFADGGTTGGIPSVSVSEPGAVLRVRVTAGGVGVGAWGVGERLGDRPGADGGTEGQGGKGGRRVVLGERRPLGVAGAIVAPRGGVRSRRSATLQAEG